MQELVQIILKYMIQKLGKIIWMAKLLQVEIIPFVYEARWNNGSKYSICNQRSNTFKSAIIFYITFF